MAYGDNSEICCKENIGEKRIFRVTFVYMYEQYQIIELFHIFPYRLVLLLIVNGMLFYQLRSLEQRSQAYNFDFAASPIRYSELDITDKFIDENFFVLKTVK